MEEKLEILSTARAVILGHAVGDALGVPVEFKRRHVLDEKPLTDMIGYGTFNLPAGSWSDDTSMTLCALDVLADGQVDYTRIMENFVAWCYKGAFTPCGYCFDIGGTCQRAILNYHYHGVSPTECGMQGENSNGNGSLMRILPFALYSHFMDHSAQKTLDLAHTASTLTHAHVRSQMACGIYAVLLRCILHRGREGIKNGLCMAEYLYADEPQLATYARLFAPDFADLPRDEIRSSGYVVDSLEAAVWCLMTTDSYRDCVLKAVNLGEDTDTIAAIAGGLAGALYGVDAIPAPWLEALIRRELMEEMCARAAENWVK